MTITATPSSTTADSYVTLVEADAYHAARLHNATWSSASTLDKEAALKWATRILDEELWIGARTEETQVLKWPRAGVVDWDGFVYDTNVIPVKIKNAQCELAFLLVGADRTVEGGTEGFKKIKVGSIELEIDSVDRLSSMSPTIYRMVREFLQGRLQMERG